MSRRTRAPRREAAPAKPGARDAATINSIKFSELTVGLEVEGDKFAGVAKIKSIEQMKDRTDDNGDQVAVLRLRRPVGRMPMDPYYIMPYDKFWLVGAKTQTPQDARDSDDDFYVPPAAKRSRAERAKDVENKALQEAAEAEERSNKRQREMEEDAKEEDARTEAPAPAPSPGSRPAEWLNDATKEHIDVMNVAELKAASSELGLSTVGLKDALKKRLMSHLKLGGAASGYSNPSRASLPNPPASPPGTTTGVTVNAGQEWFPQQVVEGGELSTQEKELLTDEGMNTSSACLLRMEPGELRSTYLNVMRCTNKEATDDELVAEVDAMDRDQMISPLERFVRAGRLTLFVDRDDGKLKVGLYDLPPADLLAAEARAEALKVRLVSVAL